MPDIKEALEELTKRLTAREAAAAPAKALVGSSKELIDVARSEVTALATPDAPASRPYSALLAGPSAQQDRHATSP